MLFAHSYSPVEQSLQRCLSQHGSVTAINGGNIESPAELQRLSKLQHEKVLLYSFQQLDRYRHLDDFEAEHRRVSWLATWAEEEGFRRIILISYPGAYPYSDNLFLQYKGLAEQRFSECGVPTVVLKVQGIHDSHSRRHSFHALFYDKREDAYYLPQKKMLVTYSVSVENLTACIIGALNPAAAGQYDVFDEVADLPSMLLRHSQDTARVHRLLPAYLYVRSFLGKYQSPTMLELFLRPLVPMYSHRTVRDLGVPMEPTVVPVLQQHASIPSKKTPGIALTVSGVQGEHFRPAF